MQPDYLKAATAAAETLIKYGISSTPVSPLPILKKLPGVLVVSYENMASDMCEDRRCIISMFGEKNQDAFTSINMVDGKPQYLVTYNQRLSLAFVQRALARELGHILLGHDGSRPDEVRTLEAKCFAHHLLVPRALIHAIEALNIQITTEVLGNLTGCYDYCLSCMRRTPGVAVPAELNRQVQDQFMPYILNFFEFYRYASRKDHSALADFGTYMEGYEE
ncbi:MAG: ImmA/IrrE family metallo-endopeptidase [Clostridia bacterium]|nr:ImmA/IrrE family metallo-endopeptidase [Clostridia bacterium]